jgi:tetratricopeptide (TPR) repeat protein
MNIKNYTIFWIICLVFVQCSPTAQENFLRANAAYNKDDFKSALASYQLIDNKGAAVWYNMGNCYYHQERYSDALVSWKRALKNGGAFLQSMVDRNCQNVYQKLGITLPTSFFNFLTQTINSFSLMQWQMIFLIFVYIFLGLFIYLQRKKRFFTQLFFLILVCLNGTGLGIKYWMSTYVIAVVKHESYLVAGTDERFSKLGSLEVGHEVIVKEKRDQWSKIESNGQTGWVLAENIEYI